MEIREFIRLLWKKKLWVIGIPLLAGLSYFCLAMTVITPRYESTALIMPRNYNYYPWVHAYDQEEINREMVFTCARLLSSSSFRQELIKTLPFETSLADLHSAVKISSESDKYIRVRVCSPDPHQSSAVVDGMLSILPAKMAEFYGCEVLILDSPTGPGRQYLPDPTPLSLGLVMGMPFLWTVSLVMLNSSQAWERC